jgi:hypothetical protein
MNKKIHLTLDVLMTALMLTLYSKRFIGMKYHEIAGLILIGIVLMHIIINIKTLTAMSKKFLKVPASIKTGLIIDILLILCFIWFGISGIMISHTIFTGISSQNMIFKLGHMFAGGLSVILLGIHIGLHICRKPMKTVTAVILSVIILLGGVYGTVKSSEIRWLSMPFSMTAERGGMEKPQFEHQREKMNIGDGQKMEKPDKMPMDKMKNSGQNRQSLSLLEKLQNIFMFLGMMMTCAMATYWIIILKKRKI